MSEELARQGRSVGDVLEPVISWLNGRGFYTDAKAYRFLLPALRRADRNEEVLDQVNVSFVSESIAHAHPFNSIQRNLALAADIAARTRNWPALIRCVELHRSAQTCFFKGQNTWHDYWLTYLELFGPVALSGRLLFDGRPTQSYEDGLLVCSILDDAGGIAPWGEYLELPYERDTSSDSPFDSNGKLTTNELVSLAGLHGQLRLGEVTDVMGRVCNYLSECGNDFKPLYVRTLAARIARMINPPLVERLALRANPARRGGPRMTPRAAAVLRLGLADEYVRLGDSSSAFATAMLALEGADTPELALACVTHGAPNDMACHAAIEPATLPIAVGPDSMLENATGVRDWVASVRILADDQIQGPLMLENERFRVQGKGWYRCWLRFVLELAVTESAKRAGQRGNIIKAFRELTYDMHPFTGKPRACDLYMIERVIQETLACGVSLLDSQDEWVTALDILSTVSDQTASRLDREDGGPLSAGTLIEILMPYTTHPVGGVYVRGLIEKHIQNRNKIGTYYPVHADYEMRLARVRHAVNETALAQEAWRQGAIYLSGYGWRKDPTVFDIIHSVPTLLELSQDAAVKAIADAQKLANAVIVHTDGRSTNQAPNSWFLNLLAVHSATAIALLAHTITEDDDGGGWPMVEAIHDVVRYVGNTADPALINALLTTVPFKIEAENKSEEIATARLAPVVRLAAVDRRMAAHAIRHVAAEVVDDGRRHIEKAAKHVESTAEELGLLVPRITLTTSLKKDSPSSTYTNFHSGDTLRLEGIRFPQFSANSSFVDLLAGLRCAGRERYLNNPDEWNDIILPLSYHLSSFIDSGREDDARRLLRFFARDTMNPADGKAHPLGKLALALDQAGYSQVAAFAYALAYTATRGGNGYLVMGDRSHNHLIERGIALDRDVVMQVIAEEIAYNLRGDWSTFGTSRHVVDRLAGWGDASLAEATWREAFTVVAHRLPLAPSRGWFVPLDAERLSDWSVDESLVALLLAKVSDPVLAHKNAALAGIINAIQRRPDTIARPLGWWLTRNTPVTSLLLILHALWDVEAEPFTISKALEDTLTGYAGSNLWGARRLAMLLLGRAGRPITSTPARDPVSIQNVEGLVLTPRRRALLLSADVTNALDMYAPLWPELPDRVARRLNQILEDGEKHQRRIAERYQISYGRDDKAFPPTPVLLWEWELFQAALHDELVGLNAQLWATGEWAADLEDELVFTLHPDAMLHLGFAASRTVRPAWPEPTTLLDGFGALLVLGDDDPAFTGWTRLAMREVQYLSDPARPYGRPIEEVTVYAGAIAIPLGTRVPSRVIPFTHRNLDDWWQEPPPIVFPPQLPCGPLVGLHHTKDWLGDAVVLIPPIELRTYLDLYPPEYGAPLVWSDASGVPAIALRTWRVRNDNSSLTESVEFEGSDLIIRPDILERLNQLWRVPIKELRFVSRQPIAEIGNT